MPLERGVELSELFHESQCCAYPDTVTLRYTTDLGSMQYPT